VFMKRSTREFFKAWQGVKGATLFDRLHGYVYGRWIYLYISIGLGEHPVSRPLSSLISFLSKLSPARDEPVSKGKTFADTYHGKVITTGSARQLVQVQEDIHLPDLEHVIPYTKARDIIMTDPDHIVIIDCACRSARLEPCLPLDVCMIVGEPFASFVLDHHPDRSRRRCWDGFMRFVIAAHVVVVRCTRCGMGPPCWLLRGMSARWNSTFASLADYAPSNVLLVR